MTAGRPVQTLPVKTTGKERERETLGGEMEKISLPTRFEFEIKKSK
jgi:hypothetical protein